MALKKDNSLYRHTPDTYMHETNDCAVRALAVVTGEGYAMAHYVLNEFGRKERCGTFTSQIIAAAELYGFKKVNTSARWKRNCWGDRNPVYMTLNQFVKAYPEGTYLVLSGTHAAAVIDGVQHDWAGYGSMGARTRIIEAYRKGE